MDRNQRLWAVAGLVGTETRAEWAEVKAHMHPDDQLWTFETQADSETRARVSKGLALVRKRRVIAMFTAEVKRYYWPDG